MYWTPCVTYCIDLISEYFEKDLKVVKLLLRRKERYHLHSYKNNVNYHVEKVHTRKRLDKVGYD